MHLFLMLTPRINLAPLPLPGACASDPWNWVRVAV